MRQRTMEAARGEVSRNVDRAELLALHPRYAGLAHNSGSRRSTAEPHCLLCSHSAFLTDRAQTPCLCSPAVLLAGQTAGYR